jgi:hypothetical protein
VRTGEISVTEKKNVLLRVRWIKKAATWRKPCARAT